MKIINDKESGKKLIISVALGVAVGFVAMLLLISFFAFIMLKADLGDGISKIFSTVALLASALACGYVSSKKLGSKLMLVAPFSGFVFYLIVAIIGMVTTHQSIGKQGFLRLLLCAVFAGIGAFLSALKSNKKTVI